ncbi:hypothetical protein RvY_13264 [Ramazzottius varieornatus]|uniref:Uncharacterized protein n=1 Tax=Ramazzottius varieornatus TaxID=947166 RepID=A0A1D1VMC1_RAMVA|nr:hypothetical protein RvY_13264 [Ramazzottius varieornatus]
MSNGREMETDPLDLDIPSMVADMFADQPTSAEASHTPEVPAAQPGASTSNRKPVRVLLRSSSSSDDRSKADKSCEKRWKTKPEVSFTLSGNKKPFLTRRKFLCYDEPVEGYQGRMLNSEAEKIGMSRRELQAPKKAAEYQQNERMEALSVQRLKAEARGTEAQPINLLLQIQLASII